MTRRVFFHARSALYIDYLLLAQAVRALHGLWDESHAVARSRRR